MMRQPSGSEASLGERLFVGPMIVRDAVASDHRAGTVGAAFAMDEDQIFGVQQR